ncbi:MAG: hypothetical protein WDZ51_11075 [Pirellulaceae bacterium]
MSIEFITDVDGFISQECPACNGRFKIIIGEGSPEPISFCPYCGHEGRECWWTPEQVEYINAAQKKMVTDYTNSKFKKMAQKFNRSAGSGFLKMTMSFKPDGIRHSPAAPAEPDFGYPIYTFSCCNERIKQNKSENRLFCIICGSEHQV